MEIKSLAKTDFDTIFKAFNQAFADYEITKVVNTDFHAVQSLIF